MRLLSKKKKKKIFFFEVGVFLGNFGQNFGKKTCIFAIGKQPKFGCKFEQKNHCLLKEASHLG